MKQITYFNSWELFKNPVNDSLADTISGGRNFSKMFSFLGGNFSFSDRTGNIISPLNTVEIPVCAIPTYTKEHKPFDQICDERAIELMAFAKQTNRKLMMMYSGGIDSTLVLSSFFKNCSEYDVRNNLVVFANHNSIQENPTFFRDYVIRRAECIPSYNYGNYAGTNNYIMISGEQADQLFTVSYVLNLAHEYGMDILEDTIDNRMDEQIKFITDRVGNTSDAENILNTLRLTTKSAPVDVSKIRDFWWWVCFSIMWQSNYVRTLPFIKNVQDIKFEDNYTTFFGTKDFQLWSMNNRDSIMKQGFNTYKYISKEYIYNYNKDVDYREKKKKNGSLGSAIKRKIPYSWIDENMVGHYNIPDASYFNSNNTFNDWK